MKTNLLISGILLGAVTFISAATNDLTTALQRGLFEEEANQNLGAAIQAYQSVANQFDKDRKLAATAIFRLGECYRKQGNTNDAATQYQRILRDFSDQPTLVTLSRQNLAAMGNTPVGNTVGFSADGTLIATHDVQAPRTSSTPVLSDAARQEQKRLLEGEIELVQQQLESQQAGLKVQKVTPDAIRTTERELLQLKRQLAALDAGLPISFAAPETTSAISTDADEVRRIQALLKDSPDLINAPDRKGVTLLQAAAAKGKLAVVKLLLDSGAAVDGLQQPGLTPLHCAAANGHKAVVDLLLSKGAKADSQTEGGATPLHLAALKGYETVARALLAAGAPVNAQPKRTADRDTEDVQYHVDPGQTPLHLAANAGYTGMVELLLAKGTNPDAEDGSGRTPLSYAVQNHSEPVVKLLLAAHANPNAGRGNLPLAVAAGSGDLAALKLLLTNGADPNTNTAISWPLLYAVQQRHADAVAELLRFKADPNPPDVARDPLLFDALLDAPTLKALLDAGADLNVRNHRGNPLLLQAVQDRNQPAVELLLAHKADVNAALLPDAWTPLHSAAGMGTKAITELLLKAGASVKARNKDGETPLHVAVRQGQRDMVELLLANKADPDARDNAGLTPLDLAKHPTRSNIPSPGMPAQPVRVTRPEGPGAIPNLSISHLKPPPHSKSRSLNRWLTCCAGTARWMTCLSSTGS